MRSRSASRARQLSRRSASSAARRADPTMTVPRKRLAQLLAPPFPPLQVFHHRPAHAEDERADLIDVADRAAAQLLDRQQHHLLDQIARRVLVAQMAQPVEPDAWREAAIQLALGRLRPLRAPAPRPRARDRRRSSRRSSAIARQRYQPAAATSTPSLRASGHPVTGSGVAAALTSRMTSPLAISSAAPSPTNVEPCMAASVRGCSAARLASCRFVFSVYGT